MHCRTVDESADWNRLAVNRVLDSCPAGWDRSVDRIATGAAAVADAGVAAEQVLCDDGTSYHTADRFLTYAAEVTACDPIDIRSGACRYCRSFVAEVDMGAVVAYGWGYWHTSDLVFAVGTAVAADAGSPGNRSKNNSRDDTSVAMGLDLAHNLRDSSKAVALVEEEQVVVSTVDCNRGYNWADVGDCFRSRTEVDGYGKWYR